MDKLDVGSGFSRKNGYIRLDADKRCSPDILAEADKIPVKDNRFDEVYASHILEHYDPEDVFRVMREWCRVLKSGGKIIIKVPNIGWACRAVTLGQISWQEFRRVLFGNNPTANEFMRHKDVFCEDYLERMLFISGFINQKKLHHKDSPELIYEATAP